MTVKVMVTVMFISKKNLIYLPEPKPSCMSLMYFPDMFT